MDEDVLMKMKKQHFDNYINAIIDNINNNTNVLVNDDLMSLFRKPPLDSMDVIKSKLLSLAKKNKIILDSKEIDLLLEKYRKTIIDCCNKIKKHRIDMLVDIVNNLKDDKTLDVIKINKKDFVDINKTIKSIIK